MRPIIVGVTSATPQERGAKITYSKYLITLKSYYSKALPMISSFNDIKKLADSLKQTPLTFVVVCTGGTSDFILELANYTIPILLSHSEQNSLASALNAAQMLRRKGIYTEIIHELNEDSLRKIELYSRVNEALCKLKSKKAILLGADKNWAKSRYNIKLLERIGISFEFISLEELLKNFEKTREDSELVSKFIDKITVEPKEDDIKEASRIFSLLEKYLSKNTILGFRCFPFLVKTKITPCLALSHALDKGITATCEADVSAMILMEIVRILTGKPGFIANLEDINDKIISVAHCTIATSLCEKIMLRSHFETGYSVSISGIIRENKEITVACFSPDFKRMFVSTGKIIRGVPWSEAMCRTQLQIRLDKDPEVLIKEAINRHVVIAFAAIQEELELLARILNVELIS